MKAFVITMDALAAMAFIIIAAIFFFSQTFQPLTYRGLYLKQLTLDTLTVADKAGYVGQAIEGNSTLLRQLIQGTPDLYCTSFHIYDEDMEAVLVITKENCGTAGGEVQVASRAHVSGGAPYMARCESWYRRD
jgi:hypothetical protein